MNVLVTRYSPLAPIPFVSASLPGSLLVLKYVRNVLFKSLLASASSCQRVNYAGITRKPFHSPKGAFPQTPGLI